MRLFKGFMTISTFTGESVYQLNTLGLTYSTNVVSNVSDTHPTYDLKGFHLEGGENLNPEELTKLFQLVTAINAYTQITPTPYNETYFINYIKNSIPQGIEGFKIGEFKNHKFVQYPEWFSCTVVVGEPISVKVWLLRDSFLEQYDEYAIKVVGPLEVLDSMTGIYTDALDLLTIQSSEAFNARIEAAKEGEPPTSVGIIEYNFHNKLDPSIFTPVRWAVLRYGPKATDENLTKAAIEEYIAQHTEAPLDLWRTLFPDVFMYDEFLILPVYQKLAFKNLTTRANTYSTMVRPQEILEWISSVFDDTFTIEHIEGTLEITNHPYRTLALAIIPGLNNSVGRNQFSKVFKDYIPVATSHPDFMRMMPNTRAFLKLLWTALRIAETGDPIPVTETSIRKVRRGNYEYTSFHFEQLDYLVAYRYNAFYEQ